MLKLETFLPYRLNRLTARVSERTRAVYRRYHDLTVPEWRVLASLFEHERMTAREIGLYSAMHKTKVSRAVRALEQRRWLRRETNMANRREEFLWLTSQGRQAFSEMAPALQMFENALMERTGHSRADILAILDAIEQAVW